jgi:cytochrome oxidase Cu insertion factor (SCO1/SenC/PrrC family)
MRVTAPAVGSGAARVPERMSRGMLLVAAIAAIAIGAGVGLALHALLAGNATLQPATVSMRNGLYGDATWPVGSAPAPPITTLRDQSGARFSLASLRGHTVALAFFDSHCHQECPLEGRQLAAAERALPGAQRPQLVVVSVNPLDTRVSATAAIREWGLAGVAPWHWLMGTHAQLARVWAAYNIQVSPPIGGDINHTEALYLIDRRGYERAGYLWPFASHYATYDMRVLATRRTA